MASHFIIDMGVIADGVVDLALVLHKSNVYSALSIIGFISVLSAFVNGARFVASNFSIDRISSEWLPVSC